MAGTNNQGLYQQEIEINEILGNANAEIKKLEDQLKTASQSKGPQLNFNPPGMGNAVRQNHATPDQLKRSIEDIKAKTIADTDKISKTLPADVQKRSKDNVTKSLYPDKGPHNKEKGLAEKKDISASQKFMLGIKADHLRDQSITPQEKAQKPRDISASQQYMSKIKGEYTKSNAKEGNDKETKAGAESKNDKETQGYSMSTKFKQSLGFEKIPGETPDGPSSPTKSKGVDKDKDK